MRKNVRMRGVYSRRCEGRPGGREEVDSESTPSSVKKGRAREGSDFAGKRGNPESKQDRFERFVVDGYN